MSAPVIDSVFIDNNRLKFVGENFFVGTRCTLNYEPVVIVRIDDFSFTVPIPTEQVKYIVRNNYGSSTFYFFPPVIYGIYSNSNYTVIQGEFFLKGTTITFNGESILPSSININRTVIYLPINIEPGTYIVTTSLGSASFYYNPPPVPPVISVTYCITRGILTITGKNFTSSTIVLFGTNPVQPMSVTPNNLEVSIPSGSGTTSLKVNTQAGDSNIVDFTYIETTPTISGNYSGYVNSYLTITGTNFTGATSVLFGLKRLIPFSFTPTTLGIEIPEYSDSVPLKVTNPAGDSNIVEFIYISIPIINSDNYDYSGSAGNSIVIGGTYFTGVTYVWFGSNIVIPISVGSRNITVEIPSGSGIVPLKVTNPLGDSNIVNFTYLPNITGNYSGVYNENLTITGTSFTGDSEVWFGSVIVTPTSFTPTSIIVKIPDGVGTTQLKVTNSVGDSNIVNFTYLPNITGNYSGVYNENLTITGTNFTADSDVWFGSIKVTPTTATQTSIIIAIPLGTDTVSLVVTTPTGISNIRNFTYKPFIGNSDTFGYSGKPLYITGTSFTEASHVWFGSLSVTPTSVTPTSIRVEIPSVMIPDDSYSIPLKVTTPAGDSNIIDFSYLPKITGNYSGFVNTDLTITGTNFTGATMVKFGPNTVTPTDVTSTTLKVVIPDVIPGGTSSVPLQVTTPVGVSDSVGFSYLPKITGTYSGLSNTSLTINGLYFSYYTLVKFDSVTVSPYYVDNSLIKVFIPPGSGTIPLRLTIDRGESNVVNFIYITIPTISGYYNGISGETLTITGTNFTGTNTVWFGTESVIPSNVTQTSLRVNIPPGVDSVPLKLTTPAGDSTSVNFTYYPIITGTYSGLSEDTLVIDGTSFTGATYVWFGTEAVIPSNVTSTSIRVIVPPGNDTVSLKLTTPAGISNTVNFKYKPFIIVPAYRGGIYSGLVGDRLIINGTNFTGVTTVWFGLIQVEPTYTDSNNITVEIPLGTETVSLKLNTPAGESNTVNFIYKPIISPTYTGGIYSGLVEKSLTITGKNFMGASVHFGSIIVTPTVVTSTSLIVKIPPGNRIVSLKVTTPAGDSESVDFKYAPIISGTYYGSSGSTISIKGENFYEYTWFRFFSIIGLFETQVASTYIDSNNVTVVVPYNSKNLEIIQLEASTTDNVNFITSDIVNFTYVTIPSFSDRTTGIISNFTGSVGNTIIIKGSRFTGATSVLFDSFRVSPTNVTESSLIVTIPEGSGNVNLKVATPAGESQHTLFQYTNTPTISGNYSGSSGSILNITGTYLTNILFFQVGSILVKKNNLISGTGFIIPPGTGTVSLKVITKGGESLPVNFTYTGISTSPTIDSNYEGSVGRVLSITGTNFTQGSIVSFNSNEVIPTFVNSTKIDVMVPSGSGTVLLKVTTSSGDSLPVNFKYTSIGWINLFEIIPTIINSTELNVVVPNGSGTVLLKVTAPSGESNPVDFTYISIPIISVISGGYYGSVGNNLVISGTYFTGIKSIWFGLNNIQITPNNLNPTSISVIIPDGDGTIPLRLTTIAGDSNSVNFTYLPRIDRNYASLAGRPLIITGRNFTQNSSVSFNSNSLESTYINSTTLSVEVPPGTGIVSLMVTTSAGDSEPVVFTYLPRIIGNYSGIPSTLLTIRGTDFTRDSTLLFYSSLYSITVFPIYINETELRLWIPYSVGNSTLTVITPLGNSLPVHFDYIVKPTINNNYSGLQRSNLVINGTNFTQNSTVSFNSIVVNAAYTNPTDISVVIPDGTGTVSLMVTTSAGDSNTVNFSYIPTISGTYYGKAREQLTITGTNFTQNSIVLFSSRILLTTYINESSLRVVIPEGSGRGILQVETSPTISNYADFLYLPIISGNYIDIAGETIIITGTNFTQNSTVSFNSNVVNANYINDSSLRVVVPPGNNPVSLMVTTSAGDSNSVNFSYLPTINGTYYGKAGEQLTITGTNFSGANMVRFGSNTVIPTEVTSTTLRVVIPNGNGSVLLIVTTEVGDSLPVDFIYPPTISGNYYGSPGMKIYISGTSFTQNSTVSLYSITNLITPIILTPTYISPILISVVLLIPEGSVSLLLKVTTQAGDSPPVDFFYLPNISQDYNGIEGTPLTITGTNFAEDNTVLFETYPSNEVKSVTPTYINPTTLSVVVPPGVGTVMLRVKSLQGESGSRYFSYIASVTGNYTGLAGGTLDIRGTHFTDYNIVVFGSSLKSVYSNYINSTFLRVDNIPDGAGTVLLTVEASPFAGSSTISTPVNFSYIPKIIGNYSGRRGTQLVITGRSFTQDSIVLFDSEEVTPTYINITSLRVDNIPDGIGTVLLSVKTSPTISTPVNFTYLPTINGTYYGRAGEQLTITGINFNGVTSVQFGSNIITITPNVSLTSISVVIPDGLDTIPLKLTNSVGDSNIVNFTYLPNISGNYIGISERTLTITGKNFNGVTSVSFGSNIITITPNVSLTSISVVIPDGLDTVPLKLTNSAGDSNIVNFTYLPKITGNYIGISGRTLTITGKNFNGVTSVSFDSNIITITPNFSLTSISVDIPDGIDTVPLNLTNSAGDSNTVNFTYLPNITGTYYGKAREQLTITGKNFNGVTSVSFNSNIITITPNVSLTSITVVIPDGLDTVPLKLTTSVGDSNTVNFTYNTNNTNNTTSTNICFFSGTPIQTDQGKVEIDKINVNKHTINKNKIIAITKTKNETDDSLVLFKKNSIAKNYPRKDTIITRRHKILYKGVFKEAQEYVNETTIYEIKYNDETLYNVLLDKHSTIKVNNLICETLHPENKVALFYKQKMKEGISQEKILIQFKTPIF